MSNGHKYMTNSCCPGFYSFIHKKYPSEGGKISSTVSPMIATARYVKSKDPDAKVVFIGPCTAKKSEAVRAGISEAVDYVITFEELLALFQAFKVNPYDMEDDEVSDGSVYGRGFGMQGGLTVAIEHYIKDSCTEVDFKPVKISGVDCKKMMTIAKVGKLPGNFIEGMMCDGGCINGAGVIVSPMKSKLSFTKINGSTPVKAILSNSKLSAFDNIELENETDS